MCSAYAWFMPHVRFTCRRTTKSYLPPQAAILRLAASNLSDSIVFFSSDVAHGLQVPPPPVIAPHWRLVTISGCHVIFPLFLIKDRVIVDVKVSSSQSRPTSCSTQPFIATICLSDYIKTVTKWSLILALDPIFSFSCCNKLVLGRL